MDVKITNTNRKNRKPSIDMSSMLYGKVPPQAKELEEAVLGAIMLEKSAFDTVSEIIKPECFYVEAGVCTTESIFTTVFFLSASTMLAV
jgi:replicative DNA helicase